MFLDLSRSAIEKQSEQMDQESDRIAPRSQTEGKKSLALVFNGLTQGFLMGMCHDASAA